MIKITIYPSNKNRKLCRRDEGESRRDTYTPCNDLPYFNLHSPIALPKPRKMCVVLCSVNDSILLAAHSRCHGE